MSTGFQGDYTSAVFSAMGDSVKKVALLVSVPVLGQFVGYNCYDAPRVISNLQAGGPAGLSVSSFLSGGESFAMMPLYWLGALMMSLTHLPTLLYPAVLLCVWGKLWVAEDEWWRSAAVILIIQPLDTWYVMCAENHGMSRGDCALSGVILVLYEIAAIGAAMWYARQRESV